MIDNSNIDYPLQIAIFALLNLKNTHSKKLFSPSHESCLLCPL